MTDDSPRIGPLLGWAAVIGVAASLLAVLFTVTDHTLQHLLWTELPDSLGMSEPAWWWVYLLLLVGAVLVWAACRLPGHGGHSPLEGVAIGVVGTGTIVSVLLAALASLSFGAVLGPEAPLLAIGSAVAAFLYRKQDPTNTQLLMAAGSVAAMGMILGNPLVTMILVLEAAALMGSVGGKTAMMKVLPAFVALGFGYLVQVGVGDWGGFGESVLAVPGLPAYDSVRSIDVLVTIVLAVVVALAVDGARGLGHRYSHFARNKPLVGLLIGGFIIATASVAVTGFTGEPFDTVLFSGQASIPEVLSITSVGSLILILVAKAIAYGVSLGAGFRGGLIFPATYLGVVGGVIAANLIDTASVSALAAAGIAAGAGAALRLPVTSALLAVLLCSSAGMAVTTTAIIGAVIGVLIRSALDQRAPERHPEPASHQTGAAAA